MLTPNGPKVLEYNCRLGDPETQSILMRADFDFAQACFDAASGKLDGSVAKWKPEASICVVVASEGYPENPIIGKKIKGLAAAEAVSGAVVFHAGTRHEDDGFYTSGGRVLGVSATGASLEAARSAAYSAVAKLEIEGAHFRRDIGVAGLTATGPAETKIASGTANG